MATLQLSGRAADYTLLQSAPTDAPVRERSLAVDDVAGFGATCEALVALACRGASAYLVSLRGLRGLLSEHLLFESRGPDPKNELEAPAFRAVVQGAAGDEEVPWR